MPQLPPGAWIGIAVILLLLLLLNVALLASGRRGPSTGIGRRKTGGGMGLPNWRNPWQDEDDRWEELNKQVDHLKEEGPAEPLEKPKK
jgi:hypothetical protein